MIRCVDFHGLQAVEFSKGDYTALLVPSVGANLVRLANTRLGAEILRTPAADEVETFRSRPQIFGLPILFPPNRIEDGRYTFDGRTYQYPITIEKEHNYHHGILKGQPFVVSKAVETDDEVLIECRYYSNAANDAIFRDFPHEFKCKIVYRLSAGGLEQEVMLANRSRTPMPVGVGFHTPMRIPFADGTDADYVMRVAVGEQVELSDRNLPTGRKLPLSEQFAKLRDGGLRVTGCEAIEAGFTLREIEVDGKPFRGALVENLRTGVRTFYEVDEQTTYWT
ncbi:MAG: aldose 1-epimerase, partial [Alistipes sp.]|nr:aldose 1-epimerase [Alistipes sp.]